MANFSDYIIQHILYIKSVEKSIRHQTTFIHKKPTECAFGKMFYAKIKPDIATYSPSKRQLIEQMEQIHINFHEAALQINSITMQLDQLGTKRNEPDAWYYSSRLINMLNALEKMND